MVTHTLERTNEKGIPFVGKWTHILERTNEKGIPFVGKCTCCGMTGLTASAVMESCANTNNLSNDDALLLVIEGEG